MLNTLFLSSSIAFRKHFTTFLFLSIWVFAFPTLGWGQSPADGVGFERDPATNVISFWPECNGAALDASVLSRYHWFWDFGNGDYSLEATPQRNYWKFGGTISNVSLRVTNIKDDDPEEEAAATLGCPAGDCNTLGESFEEAMPNDIWECVTNGAIQPTYFGNNYPQTSSVAVTVIPSCAPKPGHLIKYAIHIKNFRTSTLDFNCRVDATPNLLPTNGDNPQIWPEGLSINTVGDQSFITGLRIPRESERTIVLEYRINAETQLGNSEGLRVLLDGYHVNFQVVGVPDTVGTLKGTRQNFQSVQSAWDPNFIKAYPGEEVGLGQRILYHVHYENIGNAPTQFVKVEIDLPDALNNVNVLNHRMGNSNPVSDCPSGNSCRFYIMLEGDTIYRFQDRRLEAGENGELFLEAMVPNTENLCGEVLEGRLQVAFDNSANILEDVETTHIVCCEDQPTIKECEIAGFPWYLAVMVILALLILLLIYLLLRKRRPF